MNPMGRICTIFFSERREKSGIMYNVKVLLENEPHTHVYLCIFVRLPMGVFPVMHFFAKVLPEKNGNSLDPLKDD